MKDTVGNMLFVARGMCYYGLGLANILLVVAAAEIWWRSELNTDGCTCQYSCSLNYLLLI